MVAHQCGMEFQKLVVFLGGPLLTCKDRHGRLLLSEVQVVQDTVVPARTKKATLTDLAIRLYEKPKIDV